MPRLHEANDAEQSSRDEIASKEWPFGGIPDAAYRDRENDLRRHPCVLSRRRSWFWVADGYSGVYDAELVLGSCETYRLPVHKVLPERTPAAHDKSLQRAACCGAVYGIASVLVQDIHRRKGYATQLLEAVLDLVRADDSAVGAMLYSDVDPAFYERMGFVLQGDIYDLVTPVAPSCHVDGMSWAGSTCLECSTDTDLLHVDLSTELPDLSNPFVPAREGALLILPPPDQLEMNQVQVEAQHMALRHTPSTLSLLSATVRETGAKCVWSYHWQSDLNELSIQWIDAFADMASLRALWGAAMMVAAANGFTSLRAWHVPSSNTEHLRELFPSISKVPRSSSKPMFLAFSKEAAPWIAPQRASWL